MIAHTLLIVLGSAILWVLLNLLKAVYSKSELDNVRGPENNSFLAGNLEQCFALDSWDWHARNTKLFGRVARLWGPFGTRVLLISDPVALQYLIVDKAYTHEPPPWFSEILRITLGNGLLVAGGNRHKKQRKLLNPVFSAKHVSSLTPMFYDITRKLRNGIAKRVANGPRELDILDWFSRTALELIGVAGMGHSFEDFEQDTSSAPFTKAVKDYTSGLNELVFFEQLLPVVKKIAPNWIKRPFVEHAPSKRIRRMTHIVDVLHAASVEIFDEKRRNLEAGGDIAARQIGEGKDIISYLLRANQDAAPGDRLSEDEVLAQIMTFLFAAFDTTSSSLSIVMHLLSKNIDWQSKLRSEVTEALQDGDIPFEVLNGLPYLDAVCRETLRLYAPVSSINRQNQEESVVPLSTPIIGRNGKEMKSILLPKNTTIIMDFSACNKDRLIWGEDALEWKPDRWLKPLPESVYAARVPGIYANTMTFSGGPRACIGFRFSQLEMKVVLATILQAFIFEPANNKEISLRRSAIICPQVVGGSGKAELPIKVSLVKYD